MTVIGMFMNLTEDDREKSMRRNAFVAGYMAEINDPSHMATAEQKKLKLVTRHADKGALDTDDFKNTHYRQKARELYKNDPTPDIYFASCWPTQYALTQELPSSSSAKVVVAGLFDATDPSATTPPPTTYDPRVYGYISYDARICHQWLDKLSHLFTKKGGLPVNKVAVVYDARTDSGGVYVNVGARLLFERLGREAPSFGMVAPMPINVYADDLTEQITQFALDSRDASGVGGLVVPAGTYTAIHRQQIIDAANNVGIPAVYPNRLYVTQGGLLSYGANLLDLYRSAGQYAARIIVGDVPTQKLVRNTTFETVVNFKRANRQLNDSSAGGLVDNLANFVVDYEKK